MLLQRVDSHLEISVTDTGQGITPEFLPYVFDRFRQADASSTRSHRGLGLGLAIVKNLVELHGGTIQASSPGVNQGSTFTVSLPVVAAKSVAPEGENATGSRTAAEYAQIECNLHAVRVLTVDDEADGRNIVKRILDRCGAIVECARSSA